MIVGVDEVGRGAWAGPLVAAAVILDKPILNLKDSKLISQIQRVKLDSEITQKASAIGIGWVWPKDIDQLGLTIAITRAIESALSNIKIPYKQIIIDGKFNFLSTNPKAQAIIKADQTVAPVSAASIVAKVARDNYMFKVAKSYPNYFFERHVGYGTKLHQAALKQHGYCKLHRLSYKPLKELIAAL